VTRKAKFRIWAIVLGVGRIFSEKYRPNDLGAIFFQKYCSKFTFISCRLGQLFVFKFPNFDQKFVWAKVLIYQGSISGDILTKFGTFFHKMSGRTV
jgi:hypothetical protein